MIDKYSIKSNLKEDFRFFKGWVKNPGAVGAVKPTGKGAARHMASLLDIESGLPVLELGPGTGVITREILKRGLSPERLVSVEYDREFVVNLCKEFPDVRIVQGDAFDPDKFLGKIPFEKFCGVIGAIPLLNFPMAKRQELIERYLARVMPGGAFIQISYGLKAPVKAVPGKFSVEKSDRIYKNLPPAAIWVYRQI